MPSHGQAGLATPDHDNIQVQQLIAWILRHLVLVGAHPAAPRSRATLKLNIMPLCMCSAMWQWAIHETIEGEALRPRLQEPYLNLRRVRQPRIHPIVHYLSSFTLAGPFARRSMHNHV
jgi:hypothetical protein